MAHKMAKSGVDRAEPRLDLEYTENQKKIINYELDVDEIRLQDIHRLIMKAKARGDKDVAEYAETLYHIKTHPDEYVQMSTSRK